MTGEIIVVESQNGEEKDIGRAVGPDNAGTGRRACRRGWTVARGMVTTLNTEVPITDKDYREQIRDEVSGEVVPRRMYIKNSDVEEHGYTREVTWLHLDPEGDGEARA